MKGLDYLSCFSWQEFGFPPFSEPFKVFTGWEYKYNSCPWCDGVLSGVGASPKGNPAQGFIPTPVRQLGPHRSPQQVPVTQHPNTCSARNHSPVDEDGIGKAGVCWRVGEALFHSPRTSGAAAESLPSPFGESCPKPLTAVPGSAPWLSCLDNCSQAALPFISLILNCIKRQRLEVKPQ